MQRIQEPDYLDPSDWINQGFYKAPKFILPDKRSVSLFCKPTNIDPNDAVDRGGVNYIRNNETNRFDRFVWLESKNIFPGGGGNFQGLEFTPEQWRQRARDIGVFGIMIDEFMEGERNIPTDSAQYKAFTEEMRILYQLAGVPRNYWMCYGNFDMPRADGWKAIDGVYKGPTHEFFRKIYQSKANARSFERFQNFFAQGHYANCWPSIKYYPETPYTQNHYYEMAVAMDILAEGMDANDRWGFVSAPLQESLPDTVDRNGGDVHIDIDTARRVVNPPGIVSVSVHPQYDLDLVTALTLRCLDRCTDYIGWDVTTKVDTNPNQIHRYEGGSYNVTWTPDQPGTPAPVPASGPGYTPEPLWYYDRVMVGAHYYNELRDTAGQPFVPNAYTVERGGTTINVPKRPQYNDDVLFHAEANRGELRTRVGNGVGNGHYYNPHLGKHEWERVTTTVGGKTVTLLDVDGSQWLRGGVVHAFKTSVS